jgi:predicted transcriptional regulator
MYSFAHMGEIKEDKGVISVRPPEDSDIKEKLQKIADDTERSMNYHAVKAIDEYIKKFPKQNKK